MPDVTFIQWMTQQVGLAGFAALALWMLKGSYEQRLKDEREHKEQIERLYKESQEVLKNNAAVLMETMEQIRSLAEEIRTLARRG